MKLKGVQVKVSFEQRAPGEWTIYFEARSAGKQEDYRRTPLACNSVFQASKKMMANRKPEALVLAANRSSELISNKVYVEREQSRIEELAPLVQLKHTARMAYRSGFENRGNFTSGTAGPIGVFSKGEGLLTRSAISGDVQHVFIAQLADHWLHQIRPLTLPRTLLHVIHLPHQIAR